MKRRLATAVRRRGDRFVAAVTLLTGLSTTTAPCPAAPAAGALPGRDRPELLLQLGHSDTVFSVAVSPDGRTLASASRDGTVRLWNVQTGELTRVVEGRTMRFQSVAFSPQGSVIAAGYGARGKSGGVRLFDAWTGEEAGSFNHDDQVSSVAFSPDERFLALGSRDKTVMLLPLPRSPFPGQSGLDFHQLEPDGLLTREGVRMLKGHTAPVHSVAVSPDSQWIASGSRDGAVKLWSARTGELQRTLTGHQGRVEALAFLPDGKTLASSDEKTLILWDIPVGTIRQKETPGNVVLSFSPDGNTLAMGLGESAMIVDKMPGVRFTREQNGHVSAVAFTPDGKTLVTGHSDGRVRLWHASRVASQRSPAEAERDQAPWQARGNEFALQPQRQLPGRSGRVTSVAFSPDGRTLAVGSEEPTVRLWDVRAGALKQTLKGHRWRPVRAVAFSPDGKILASGGAGPVPGAPEDVGWEEEVRLWDAASGKGKGILRGHRTEVRAVAFSRDGRWLLSESRDGVRRWDVRTGALKTNMVQDDDRKQSSREASAFSPDGKTLATGAANGRVSLWDIPTGKRQWVRPSLSGVATSLAYSPNGTTLAAGTSNGGVILWNARTGSVHRRLKAARVDQRAHDEEVSALAFSPDGKTLTSGSTDGEVKLWDVQTSRVNGRTTTRGVEFLDAETGKLVRGDRHVELPWESQSAVGSIAFSPDGRLLAVGSADGTVRLWETKSQRLLAMLLVFPSTGQQKGADDWMVLLPDGYFAASPGAERVIRWRVARESLPAGRYASAFRRPDQVQRALRGGSPPR